MVYGSQTLLPSFLNYILGGTEGLSGQNNNTRACIIAYARSQPA